MQNTAQTTTKSFNSCSKQKQKQRKTFHSRADYACKSKKYATTLNLKCLLQMLCSSTANPFIQPHGYPWNPVRKDKRSAHDAIPCYCILSERERFRRSKTSSSCKYLLCGFSAILNCIHVIDRFLMKINSTIIQTSLTILSAIISLSLPANTNIQRCGGIFLQFTIKFI